MPSGTPLRFAIEIDAGSSPITGRWHAEGLPARVFTGWTELFAALDGAVNDARGSNDAGVSLRPATDQLEEV